MIDGQRIRHTVVFTPVHPAGSAEEAAFLDAAAELAAIPAELRLRAADVEEIRSIGDNTGCMALKGASPEYSGEVRPDRWGLDQRLEQVAQRWGIEPERDLAQVAGAA